MSRRSLTRTAGIAGLALVLAALPDLGWTEPPGGDSGPPGAVDAWDPVAGVQPSDAAAASSADPRPSSRRKQPSVVARSPRPAAAPAEPRRLELDPAAPVREILELRNKIGGVLDGTLFSRTSAIEETGGPDADEMFFRRLQAHAAAPRPLVPAPPAPHWPDQPASREQDALRLASWQLEQSAQMLEEHRLYKRADAIRALADELRKASRTGEGVPTSDRAEACHCHR